MSDEKCKKPCSELAEYLAKFAGFHEKLSEQHGHFASAMSQIRDEAADALAGENVDHVRSFRYIKAWADAVFKGKSHVDHPAIED
ncbi:MAG: hypothetical protein QGD94_06415 [Planctomycetia bacterium]|nr:hypothetical protein [Planctomycetia bacterium]